MHKGTCAHTISASSGLLCHSLEVIFRATMLPPAKVHPCACWRVSLVMAAPSCPWHALLTPSTMAWHSKGNVLPQFQHLGSLQALLLMSAKVLSHQHRSSFSGETTRWDMAAKCPRPRAPQPQDDIAKLVRVEQENMTAHTSSVSNSVS